MRRFLAKGPSPALIFACAALFVALNGASYAVVVLPKNWRGTAPQHGDRGHGSLPSR